MPNPTGKNGADNGNQPPEEELHAALLEYAKELLPLQTRLIRLQKQLDYHIGLTKLKQLNKAFNIPSSRKPLPFDQMNQLVLDKVAYDVGHYSGPEAIRTKIALDGNPLPRRVVRQIMHANWDDGFDHRFPGGRPRYQRGRLTALGPWHEASADGHVKLGSQALNMGGVGLPIYTFRDKWTGAPLRSVVVPNDRKAVVIGHVYLDMVEDYGMIPLQLTVDKGSETGEMGAFQLALRKQFAPDLSLKDYPAFVAIKSTGNITIEAFWRWWRKDNGRNLFELVTDGHKRGIYNIASELHMALFYWLWPRIVQDALDEFYEYWIKHRVRTQKDKLMPSGVSPKELYMNPELYGGRPMGIPVTNPNVIPGLRDTLGCLRKEALRWVSDEFAAAADEVYADLGAPELTALSAWNVFALMIPRLEVMEDESVNIDAM